MSFRTFKITLPADTNNHNLFSLIVGGSASPGLSTYSAAQGGTDETGITGAVPTDGILSDRGTYLEVQADIANANTLTINDRNNANTTGKVLTAGQSFQEGPFDANRILFKDYLLKGGAASQACEVRLGWT